MTRQHAEPAEPFVPMLNKLLRPGPSTPAATPDLCCTTSAASLGYAAAEPLALLRYGTGEFVPTPWPEVHIALTPLRGAEASEGFASSAAIDYGPLHGTRFAHTGEFLLVVVEQDEAAGIADDALRAYRRLLAVCREKGFPHLLRIWNFFAAINREATGLERYQRFCVGRHQAFAEHQTDFHRLLPAATAVGTMHGPLQIIVLAGTQAGVHRENPRQLSAYRYPAKYGPRSPAFARATFHSTAVAERLFIAGTSSIVGHVSLHPDDPYQQARETLLNIENVIQHSGWCRGDKPHTQGTFKTYVRDPRHLPLIRQAFHDHLGFEAPFLYLQGDICRAELLLEVEGILTRPRRAPD